MLNDPNSFPLSTRNQIFSDDWTATLQEASQEDRQQ
jgi:hypothetical protein